MAKNHKPVVVAELGRPETAAETAARKANDSRLYRQRKTVNNLVFSLLVSLGLVLVIVLIVPRGVGDVESRSVNVQQLAAEASDAVGVGLVVPEVPERWLARQAELRSEGMTHYWYIGYTTVGADGKEAYAAVVQAYPENGQAVDDAWIAKRLEQRTATGTETIGGEQWTVYDHSHRSSDGSNVTFALERRIGNTAILVYGTDSPDIIRDLTASTQAAFERIAP